jgi:hypothetical protein
MTLCEAEGKTLPLFSPISSHARLFTTGTSTRLIPVLKVNGWKNSTAGKILRSDRYILNHEEFRMVLG